MGNSSQEIAFRWLKAFRRSGKSGPLTKPYSEWPIAVRDQLAVQAELSEDEFPVLAHVAGTDDWTLLTTARLVTATGGKPSVVDVKDIRDAIVDFEEFRRRSSGEGKSPGWVKREVNRLTIFTADGQVELQLEPGRSLFGFLQVLRLAGASAKLALLRAERLQSSKS